LEEGKGFFCRNWFDNYQFFGCVKLLVLGRPAMAKFYPNETTKKRYTMESNRGRSFP
jgi:hypothetical protein